MEADEAANEPTADLPVEAVADHSPGHVSTPEAHTAAMLDLDGIQRDLADVEVALARLDAGTYWTDEVTGHELSPDLLAHHPTARRALAE